MLSESNPKNFQKFFMRSRYAIAVFVLIAVISYGSIYVPAISSDDWANLRVRVSNGDYSINWFTARPLGLIPFGILNTIFGLHIVYYYVLLGLLYVIAAFQLYLIVLNFLPYKPITALSISAISMIYPALYTRTWLTFINYIIVLCLILLYCWLLIVYLKLGRLYVLISAILCLTISLFIVEAPLGLASAWCLLLFLIYRKVGWKRRLSALLTPAIVILIYMIWRVYFATQAGTGAYDTQGVIKPGQIPLNLILGLKVLIWAWTEPIRQALGLNKNVLPFVIIGIFILAWSLGTYLVLKWKDALKGEVSLSNQEIIHSAYTILLLFGIGIIFTFAGYIPFIFAIAPNLSGMLSRVNLFASLGASVVLVSLLGIGAMILKCNRRQAEIMTGIAAIPLIFLGIMTQIWVQRNVQIAWDEQKQIYNNLFNLAPNLAENTTVYFVLPGYEDRSGFANWKRLPLQGDWDSTGALQVLYGNSSLRGDVIYTNIETSVEPTLTANGVIHYYEGRITPYDHTIFVAFDGNPKHLRIITNLQTELSINWPTPTYKPFDLIENDPPPDIDLRRLVAQ